VRLVRGGEAPAILPEQKDRCRRHPKTRGRDARHTLQRRSQSSIEAMRALGARAQSVRSKRAWLLCGFWLAGHRIDDGHAEPP